jgi:hypothetical protein
MQIELQGNKITLQGNRISSDLRSSDPADIEFNAAIDGIESLSLAMHCEGVDLSTPAMREAIETTMEAVGNNA